jgi:chromosome segregation ATPase
MAEQDLSGAPAAKPISARGRKPGQKNKVGRLMLVDTKEREVAVPSENEDLNLHVSLCEQRYQELERRLDNLDERIAKMEDQVSAVKREMAAGFNDIRLLIEKQNNARAIQVIATIGTVVAAALGVVGYLLH